MTEQENDAQASQPKKVGIGLVAGIVWAVLAGLAGLSALVSGEILPGTFLLVSAFVATPFFSTLVLQRFKVAITGGVKFGLVILLVIGVGITIKKSSNPAANADQSSSSDTSGPSEAASAPALGAEQAAFNSANGGARSAYEGADNELKKSRVRKERDKAVMSATSGGIIAEWTGTLKKLSTNGDGNAIIEIAPDGCPCTLKTWNNDFSDINDHTLVAFGSDLFKKLEAMKEGQRVRFSGTILREASLTESGSVDDPEWIVRFSDVTAMP